jgi:hypothetical protein
MDVNDNLKATLAAMTAGQGCEIEGTVKIRKVPGNFHISHHAYRDVISRLYSSGKRINFSHKINKLNFGNEDTGNVIQYKFGESFKGELDGTSESHTESMKFGEISCYYHVDISEIEYKDLTKTYSES